MRTFSRMTSRCELQPRHMASIMATSGANLDILIGLRLDADFYVGTTASDFPAN